MDSLLFNFITIKYKASGKTNIHIINNKIQEIHLKIKIMDNDHLHKHINYLTKGLSVYIMVMTDLMQNFFKTVVNSGSTSPKYSTKLYLKRSYSVTTRGLSS